MKNIAQIFVLPVSVVILFLLQLPGIRHANADSLDLEIVRDPSRQVSKGKRILVESTARCPEGKTAVSGGHSVVHGEGRPLHVDDYALVFQSVPLSDETGWLVRAYVYGKDAAVYYQAIAICAKKRGSD